MGTGPPTGLDKIDDEALYSSQYLETAEETIAAPRVCNVPYSDLLLDVLNDHSEQWAGQGVRYLLSNLLITF